MQESQPEWLLGTKRAVERSDFGNKIAVHDHKLKFVLSHCRNRDVLDLGCVQHNPENYKSRFWLHKALLAEAKSVEGLDLYEEGVRYLCDRGYHIRVGDAQNFYFDKQFDVIVAGDLVEHLEDLSGFFRSCLRHLRPDGKLLISTPNPWYWKNIAKAILWARVPNNPEHTMWLCPVTLTQLAGRHGMVVTEYSYGSRNRVDRMMPLPKGIKHGSFHAVLMRKQ